MLGDAPGKDQAGGPGSAAPSKEASIGSLGPYVALKGSEQPPLPGAQAVGSADPDQRIKVTLLLRRRAPLPSQVAALTQEGQRQMTRSEFAANHGADPHDIEQVEAFARRAGLQVTGSDVGRRSVIVEGAIRAIENAFAVKLMRYENESGSYRGLSGPIHIPADLADVIEGVFGLTDRPAARPR